VLAAVLTLSVTACGSQVGAAAVVGDTPIATSSVESQVAAFSGVAAGTPGFDGLLSRVLVDRNRAVLTREVVHELLVQAGLYKQLSDPELDQVAAASQDAAAFEAEILADAANRTQRISDFSALATLVSSALTSNATVNMPQTRFDVASFPDLAAATAARTSFAADPAAMDAVLAADAEGQSSATTTLTLSTQQFRLVPTGLFSAAPGSLFLVAGSDTVLVVRIVQQTTVPVAMNQDTLGQLDPTAVYALGGILLAAQRSDLVNVSVNPRFGSWDGRLLQVVGPSTIG
jgi:hypothetical protein